MQSALPIWAQWVQALGVPALGAILAAIGAFIAWQQKKIADIRLQHDLFDRRYKIFEAARRFISTVARDAEIELKDIFQFIADTSDAVFLFDDGIVKYLAELREKSFALRHTQRMYKKTNLTEDENAKLADDEAQLLSWISNQFEPLVEKFKPFMRLDRHHLKGAH